MITLITGVPGSGKTAKAVEEMTKIGARPLFTMGIPDLKVPHEPVPPVSTWTELRPSKEDPSLMVPVFTFPENAVIVIDEAQHVYRPRSSGSKVPDIVAAFETHRHEGIDFILLTQHPTLLDANIRRLVGKHLHVHVHPLGRRLLEWSQARDPDSKSDRADAVGIPYTPPKKVFDLYKSSQLHTKIKRRIPNSLIVMLIAFLLFVGVSIFAYQRIASRVAPSKLDQSPSPEKSLTPSGNPGPSELKKAPGFVQTLDVMTETLPVDPRRPETAPIYEGLRKVAVMPEIQGCVQAGNYCKCITQQGTDAGLPFDACVGWIKSRPFNPYRDTVASSGGAVAGYARYEPPPTTTAPANPGQADKGGASSFASVRGLPDAGPSWRY